MEQGSDLTGANWSTNAQYLRAGGGCSSMLIRRKSSTDDEYHHEDPLGVFGVITGANAALLSSNVYDACVVGRYAFSSRFSHVVTPDYNWSTDQSCELVYNGAMGIFGLPQRGVYLSVSQAKQKVGGPGFWYGQCKSRCENVHQAWEHWLDWLEQRASNACDGLQTIPIVGPAAVARCKHCVMKRFDHWRALLDRWEAECLTNCINCYTNHGRSHMPGTLPCHKRHRRSYPPVRHNRYL